jgi:hypothetical protein
MKKLNIETAETLLNQNHGFEVSKVYKTITTNDLLTKLSNRGFEVSSMVAVKPKKLERNGFQKHMVRLTHPDLKFRNIIDSRPELVVVNSYDGSSALQLMLGVFRLVCANGLVVGNKAISSSVRHVGDIDGNIDRSIAQIMGSIDTVAAQIETMASIDLSADDQMQLIEQASKLVLPEVATNFRTSDFVRVRRFGDSSNTLWGIFNRIQESAIRGGVRYNSIQTIEGAAFPKIVRGTTRAIKSIARQTEVNKSLWSMATNFGKVA